jgi:hypothetical protein
MKLELLTNATVVDVAIRLVSEKSNEKLRSSSGNSNEDDKSKSNELDYDEDEDRQEEEEEAGEIAATTIAED